MTGLKKALRSRRGFTLVELIVVLVILGVLGTVTVPALTGYVDSSKEKQAVSETQACVETVTRIAAQKYAEWQKATTNKSLGANIGANDASLQPLASWAGNTSDTPPNVTGGDVALTEGSGQYLLHVNTTPAGGIGATRDTSDITNAASVTGTVKTFTCSSTGRVVYLVYTSKDGITVVYTNSGSTTTVKTDADVVVVPTPTTTPKSDTGGDTGGDEEPRTLTVTVLKVDADTRQPLSNAKLQIFNGKSVVATLDSTATGNKVSLPAGSYTLHETEAPSGYNLASDISFTIAEVETSPVLQGNAGVNTTDNTITMADQKKTPNLPSLGDLRFTFKDSDDHNVNIQGIKFKLERTNSYNGFSIKECVIADDLTTDETGTIHIPVYNPASRYGQTSLENLNYAAADYCMYLLTPISYPEGCQQVFPIQFQIQPSDIYYPYDSVAGKNYCIIGGYSINAEFSTNNSDYGSKEIDPTDPHHLTYFNKKIPYLTINLLDKDTKTTLTGASLKLILGNNNEVSTFMNTPYKVAVKLHTGDNVPAGQPSVNVDSMLTVQETGSPLGYCVMPDVHFQIKKDGINSLTIYNYPTTDISRYTEKDNDPFTLNLYNFPVTNVTIQKIDDARNLISPNGLVLTLSTNDGGIQDSSKTVKTSVDFNSSNFNGQSTVTLLPGTYTLKETQAPANYWENGKEYTYEKAPDITFTVTKGQKAFSVSMLNHSIGKEGSDVTIDSDTVKVEFPNALNWAHKLTHDDKIKFQREMLFWQGKYYYCVPKSEDDEKNKKLYKQYWNSDPSKSKLDLYSTFDPNSPDGLNQKNGDKYIAPDPINYYKFVIGSIENENNSEKIVQLTEKVWTETSIQTVSAANPIHKGDLYAYNGKVYLYYGKSNLTSAPKGQPDEGTGKGTWDALNPDKAKIITK